MPIINNLTLSRSCNLNYVQSISPSLYVPGSAYKRDAYILLCNFLPAKSRSVFNSTTLIKFLPILIQAHEIILSRHSCNVCFTALHNQVSIHTVQRKIDTSNTMVQYMLILCDPIINSFYGLTKSCINRVLRHLCHKKDDVINQVTAFITEFFCLLAR